MYNKIKALVVDDEPLARKDLISILSEFNQIQIIGEADSIDTAREQIINHTPDLIFLDIQMPGESGFDLLEFINPNTEIIFVTAYDEYAFRAFEVNALDYLLKPVDGERIKQAIGRIYQSSQNSRESTEKLEFNDCLFLKLNNSYDFLRLNTILTINAADDYSEVHTNDGKKKLVFKKMQEWEDRLPEQHFCRIHRSTIINISEIIKIEPWYNQSYHIHINGINEPLTMSRRYFKIVKEKLK
ncbi:LytR/AlgR family response regulator transcription factor [Candidatus Neomarinimicrobiota bacterium]